MVVMMTVFSVVKRVVHVRVHRGGSPMVSAWKSLQPYFYRTEHRAAPRLCRRGSAVEVLLAYAAAEFHLRIVRKKDWMSRRSMGEWVNRALCTSNGWLRRCGRKVQMEF
jgi:hypothetical protein